MIYSLQHNSIWSHVSAWGMLHRGHVIEGYVRDQNRCFLALPIYWPYLNLRKCVIWESLTFGLVQNLFEVFLSRKSYEVHLFLFWKVPACWRFSFLSCFSTYVLRNLMGPLYACLNMPCHTSLCNQYGWHVLFHVVLLGYNVHFRFPSFASWSAFSLPAILVCALTLWSVVGLVLSWSMCVMAVNMSLLGLFYGGLGIWYVWLWDIGS